MSDSDDSPYSGSDSEVRDEVAQGLGLGELAVKHSLWWSRIYTLHKLKYDLTLDVH